MHGCTYVHIRLDSQPNELPQIPNDDGRIMYQHIQKSRKDEIGNRIRFALKIYIQEMYRREGNCIISTYSTTYPSVHIRTHRCTLLLLTGTLSKQSDMLVLSRSRSESLSWWFSNEEKDPFPNESLG